MSTILHASPVFGPVHSRRLGISLGINLLPGDGKMCSFDCIYCECGYNADRPAHSRMPSRGRVAEALEERLRQMAAAGVAPDVLTFAGNGEPTIHPHFAEIVDDTLKLRDKYCPRAKVSLLSNATMAARPSVHAAMLRIDNNILKLDTVSQSYIRLVNRPVSLCKAQPGGGGEGPQKGYNVGEVIETLHSFEGKVIIQTMFLKGLYNGINVDNTGDEYVDPWIKAIGYIQPHAVMVYTIDRETPDHELRKAPKTVLDDICARVKKTGIECTAAY